MITAVRELGSFALNKSGKDSLSALIEVINADNYPYMLVIELEEHEPYKFVCISVEDMNARGAGKYIYRQGSARGANYSPTAIITEIEKTLPIKIIGWFNSVSKKKLVFTKEEQNYFKMIKKSIEKNQVKIKSEITEKLQDIGKGCGLTLKIGGKYLAEVAVFKKAFMQLVSAKEDSISALDKLCSLCGERKTKVSAGAPAYKFYTIDKPGMISGQFIQEKSWRNYPVCQECSRALDEGKRITEQNLKFSFYGLSYTLIPKFLFGQPSEFILKIITSKWMDKDIKIKTEVGRKLVKTEDSILHILAQEQDNIMYNFLFSKKSNSAERILLLVEDVLPSRLRALFAAKGKVDSVFTDDPFHLGKVRVFFAKSNEGKRDNDLDKYFLEIIDRTFKGLPLAMPFLVTHFMREIRRDFNNQEGALFKVRHAVQTVMFFVDLNMLAQKEVNMTETIFDPVFKKYEAQLDTREKRGIFLLGALTKMLLNIQYTTRHSQPFLSQLMGLKMDERSIKGLLPKVTNKLLEYKRLDQKKAKLTEVISQYFLESPASWRLSIDELNYYFVCGMSLYKEVNVVLYGQEEVKEEEEVEVDVD